MPLALIACGGRDHSDAQFVYDTLSGIAFDWGGIHLLIEGGAPGADRQASNWAIANRIPHLRFSADWKVNGHDAGPIRNEDMLQRLLYFRGLGWQVLVVAFPSATMAAGHGGTLDMCQHAEAAGISVLKPTPEQTS